MLLTYLNKIIGFHYRKSILSSKVAEKLGILGLSTKSVIPEVALRLSGIQNNNILLDTPSTSLRVVSLSSHGSRPP